MYIIMPYPAVAAWYAFNIYGISNTIMKLAHLLHNPTAGDEEHSKNELKALMEAHGLECSYFSTKKKGWEEIDPATDLLIVAGGDGTVRKIANELLERKLIDKKLPIGLL